MKITEKKLRNIIRNVIQENMQDIDPHSDLGISLGLDRGEIPPGEEPPEYTLPHIEEPSTYKQVTLSREEYCELLGLDPSCSDSQIENAKRRRKSQGMSI